MRKADNHYKDGTLRNGKDYTGIVTEQEVRKMTRVEELKQQCKDHGFYMSTWSPGDGITRYRFFTNAGNSYFGPDNGDFTALGYKEASAYIAGRINS